MVCNSPFCSCQTAEVARTPAAVLTAPTCRHPTCRAVLVPAFDTPYGDPDECRNCTPDGRRPPVSFDQVRRRLGQHSRRKP